MATVHDTTMTPGKLELLASWLPKQEWYVGPDDPQLSRVGGFRLDDPDGEVGIEFMFVNAVGEGTGTTYHVPMTYRGAPLDGAEAVLIGTSMHGVLGKRWIYDGPADPVLTTQLGQLLRGVVAPQHQSRSDEIADDVLVHTAPDPDVRVVRVLRAGAPPDGPSVTATWTSPDGSTVSGPVVS